MGTIFAPTYANLTMGFFELTFYDLCIDKFGEELGNFIFENWSRFLDDCETLLEENKIKPNDLLSISNSINPSIQFKMEYSKDAIPFLDILIKRNNENIWMDIYYKPTDTHKCLPFSSNQPNNWKNNIPFTLARRIYTIVENTEAKMKHLENLKINLSKYRYPKQLIVFGINKALSIPLLELRTPKTISNDNSLSFITTYNPNNPNVYEMVGKSVECLERNKVDDFENLRVRKSKRQAPNLKEILTKPEFSQKQVGVFKCPDKRCECCASLLLGNSYTFKNDDKTFNLKAHFSCDSSNLLYIVICPTCGEKYTGETGVGKTKLRDCVRVYRQHIRQPGYQKRKVEEHLRTCGEYQKLKVEEHLRTCGEGTFKIFPLLQMRNSEIDLRRSYERNFIEKYKTKLNDL